MILTCSEIEKYYGDRKILDKISFHLEDREKMAVVGANGAGKTTLFKIITGEERHDGGEASLSVRARMGYLRQSPESDLDKSIYDALLSVFDDLLETEARIAALEKEMPCLFGGPLEKAMAEYSALRHSFEARDGYSYKSRIRGVLKGLGFPEEAHGTPVRLLSGGQKTRLMLGKLLLSEPELLLLDEPTNHLDIDSVEWLEGYLKNYRGAIIVVSHDRFFLDNIVTKVLEIENGIGRLFNGNYTDYAKKRADVRDIEERAYEKQQAEIARQEEIIKTLRSFNREKSIRRAESREKAIGRITRVERPAKAPEKIRLSLSPAIESGNDVLAVKDLKMGFGGKMLFENVSFEIKKGEKVALVGPNGIGKTTLFNIISRSLRSLGGSARLGVNVVSGYYRQDQSDIQNENTLFDEIYSAGNRLSDLRVRNILAAFRFRGDDPFKKISSLSGGEKGRIALAKIMVSGANFLLLDEPTNHLDIFSRKVLEDALLGFGGAVLYISHDRYFINRTAEKILELGPGGIRVFHGDYSYYLANRGRTAAPEAPREDPQGRGTWLKQKEELSQKRRQEARIRALEAGILETEERIAGVEALMYDEKTARDTAALQSLLGEKEELEEELLLLYEEWEILIGE